MIVSERTQGEVETEVHQGRSVRAERKAESRRRILDAAREVFFRDRFMAANLDEVAERAGVAKGTLYRYFESKADLYVAVLAADGEMFAQRMEEVAGAASPSAHQSVLELSRFYLEWWTRNPDYFQIFWAIDNQSVIGELPTQVVEAVASLWRRSLAILAEVIDRGLHAGEFTECDAWEMSNTLWTTANSLIQSESTEVRRRLREKTLDEVFMDFIELFLRGMAAQR